MKGNRASDLEKCGGHLIEIGWIKYLHLAHVQGSTSWTRRAYAFLKEIYAWLMGDIVGRCHLLAWLLGVNSLSFHTWHFLALHLDFQFAWGRCWWAHMKFDLLEAPHLASLIHTWNLISFLGISSTSICHLVATLGFALVSLYNRALCSHFVSIVTSYCAGKTLLLCTLVLNCNKRHWGSFMSCCSIGVWWLAHYWYNFICSCFHLFYFHLLL